MGTRVRFVKYWEKGSTAVGADQMAPALRGLGVDAQAITAEELPGTRAEILVFVKRADLRDLLRARRQRVRCVIDLQDTPVFRYWISYWMFYDAFIFRNERARRDFWWVGGRRRTIYQHWDPRYAAHRAGDRELRLAYLGIRRSLDLWERIPGLACVGPEAWFDRAREFNAHLSVRPPGREWRYKPNAKVATAAGCEAVLFTTPDCSSRELLGADYPFYVPSAGREDVEEAISRYRPLVGGPDWQRAVARMRELKRMLAIEEVAKRYLDFFRELGVDVGPRQSSACSGSAPG